jgi:hypothetical protein
MHEFDKPLVVSNIFPAVSAISGIVRFNVAAFIFGITHNNIIILDDGCLCHCKMNGSMVGPSYLLEYLVLISVDDSRWSILISLLTPHSHASSHSR